MATSLSTVSATLDVSSLSCVKTVHFSIVRLGLMWVPWFFESLLESGLNSSTSLVGCWKLASSNRCDVGFFGGVLGDNGRIGASG